jgi:hypothetical protein
VLVERVAALALRVTTALALPQILFTQANGILAVTKAFVANPSRFISIAITAASKLPGRHIHSQS